MICFALINTPPPLFGFNDGAELACARLLFGCLVLLAIACASNKKWYRRDGRDE